MTDKQIIIDGLDVSGCLHYSGNVNYLTDKNWTCRAGIQGTKCEDWSNCYFKNWQHKEQECEMWKNLTIDNGAVALKYQQQLDQLKKENEELKEFQKLLEEQMKFNKSELELSLSSEIKRSEFLLKEFKKADIQRDNWREKAEKFKQTLGKIKKIAEIRKDDINDWLAKEILQKISECEVENE